MFNDILQYSSFKHFVITNANSKSRSARSDLPISNAARKQLGIDCENLRTKYKIEHLPSHDLHIDQSIVYQDSTS